MFNFGVYPKDITVFEYQICPEILGKEREGVIFFFLPNSVQVFDTLLSR